MTTKGTKFPKTFWVAVIMEFFERGSYYGMMSVLSVFLVLNAAGACIVSLEVLPFIPIDERRPKIPKQWSP